MSFLSLNTVSVLRKSVLTGITCAAGLLMSAASAQNITSNQTGTNNGFYYTFWKDSGNASFGLHEGGRYTSQWDNSVNNWVGGKGWNPGGSKVVNYSGTYNVDNSQNSYLALYGWTKNPLVEYYVIESYGSYNPSSCSGGQDYGSFQSDGATYAIRRCQRVQQPSIEGTQTFYQYFSVRTPKKGFGNISGTITVANHFDAWASNGLNLGSHDYMVLATEGYQSSGSSDITVSEGAGGGNSGNSNGNGGSNNSNNNSWNAGTNNNAGSNAINGGNNTANTGSSGTSTASSSDIVVRARGTAGGEHINLLIGDTVVANWNLTTSDADYTYSGSMAGDIQVEFDNDGGDRDVILDYVFVNGETRQAEDMEYNTATYDGECGGGSYSGTMHCNGIIGFGDSGDCFGGNCGGSYTAAPSTGGSTNSNANANNNSANNTWNNSNTNNNSVNTNTNTNTNTNSGNNNSGNCSGYVGITFDDGPNGNTSTLINLLRQNNLTPVTWFVQGQYIASNGHQVSDLLSVGEIQNHSYTHPSMTSYSYQQVYDEISRTSQAIQNAGAPSPTLYRPPYGESTSTIQQVVQELGMRFITWDVDSEDWNGANASSIANAASRLQNGQVILLHDADYNDTNNAIAQIASNIRSRGLCPGRIDPNTGRAVAPSGGSNANNNATTTNSNNNASWNSNANSNTNANNNTSVSNNANNNNNTQTAAPTGNSSGSQCQCNWYGSMYPTCQNQNDSFGWENNQSCIGSDYCNTQYGDGGVVCN